jgi:hypothetical protein
VTEQEAINAMLGRTIVDVGTNAEGSHIVLDDGRLIVILGIIAVCEVNNMTLQ